MGVRNLSEIVKKHAPGAITSHPSLSSFAGRAVAIDANLLTTKFHFGQSSLPKFERHRHVRAWYWFLNGLARENIRPIVVFDGDTRVPEKDKENMRRRAMREQQKMRGVAEGTRGERLRELKAVWGDVAKADRDVVSKALRTTPRAAEPNLADELEVEVVESRLQEPLRLLRSLHKSFLEDAANPVYSKNQVLITVEERAFFQLILSQEFAIGDALFDDGEELAQVIARSDALGLSHRKRSMSIPKSVFYDTMKLVRALGLPVIKPSAENPHEAEGLCSTLYSLGHVDYVISEDTDVAVYGAPLIRGVTARNPSRSRNGSAELTRGMNVLDPVRLKKDLGLSLSQFVDLCLLCGTDFTPRIPFLGPAKALEFIREHGSIEAVFANQTKYVPSDLPAYLQTVRDARTIFLSLPPLPLNSILTPRPPAPNLTEILKQWGIVGSSAAWEKGLKVKETGGDLDEQKGWEESVGPDDVVERVVELDVDAEKVKDEELAKALDRYL